MRQVARSCCTQHRGNGMPIAKYEGMTLTKKVIVLEETWLVNYPYASASFSTPAAHST